MLGISDDDFLRGDVPMTKREVRIVTIANAQLAEDAVVYDIGAGTGSLTIEAAAQVPHGHVYAIERKDEAVKLIRANLAHFGVEERVTVLAKEAPEGIEKLPPCDAVLIGGSGSHLADIIDAVTKKLHDGGRIVLNCITLQTIAEALTYFRAHAKTYDYEVVQLQVNRLRQLGPYDMAKAENPIYIVTATKK